MSVWIRELSPTLPFSDLIAGILPTGRGRRPCPNADFALKWYAALLPGHVKL